MKIKLYLYKYVAVAVIVCLLAQDVALAAQGNRTKNREPRTKQSDLVPGSWSLVPKEKNVPKNFGSIDEEFQGTNGKKIIFIQDAHDSLEAQQNIARLVTHYVKQGVRTAFEEGYEGEVPSDAYFGQIRNADAKRKVTYYYLDQLKLGGAEYAHANRTVVSSQRSVVSKTTNTDWKLIGADDKEAYLENVRAFADAEKERNRIETDLPQIQRELNLIADLKFSASAKAWIKDRALYQTHKMSPADYAAKWLPQIPTKAFPLLTLLTAKANPNTDKTPLKKVSTRELLDELEMLEAKLTQKFLTESWQKEWFGFLIMIERLQKLARLQLSAAEFAELQKGMTHFHTETLAHWIAKTKQNPVVLSKRWEMSVKHAFRFYELAMKRDAAVEKTLLAWSKRPPTNDHRLPQSKNSEPGSGPDEPGSEAGEVSVPSHQSQVTSHDQNSTAVLVFGGFHKEGITKALRKNGFSYVVISPRISEISLRHQELYRESMSRNVSVSGHRPPASGLNVHAARTPTIFLRSESRMKKEINALAEQALRNPSWTAATFAARAKLPVLPGITGSWGGDHAPRRRVLLSTIPRSELRVKPAGFLKTIESQTMSEEFRSQLVADAELLIKKLVKPETLKDKQQTPNSLAGYIASKTRYFNPLPGLLFFIFIGGVIPLVLMGLLGLGQWPWLANWVRNHAAELQIFWPMFMLFSYQAGKINLCGVCYQFGLFRHWQGIGLNQVINPSSKRAIFQHEIVHTLNTLRLIKNDFVTMAAQVFFRLESGKELREIDAPKSFYRGEAWMRNLFEAGNFDKLRHVKTKNVVYFLEDDKSESFLAGVAWAIQTHAKKTNPSADAGWIFLREIADGKNAYEAFKVVQDELTRSETRHNSKAVLLPNGSLREGVKRSEKRMDGGKRTLRKNGSSSIPPRRAKMGIGAQEIEGALDAFEKDIPKLDWLADVLAYGVSFRQQRWWELSSEHQPLLLKKLIYPAYWNDLDRNINIEKDSNKKVFSDAVEWYYANTAPYSLPRRLRNLFLAAKLTKRAFQVWTKAYYFDLLMCLNYYVRDLARRHELTPAEYQVLQAKLKRAKARSVWKDFDTSAYRDGTIALDEKALIDELRKQLAKDPSAAHRWIRPVARHIRYERLKNSKDDPDRRQNVRWEWKYKGYVKPGERDLAKTNGLDYAILELCLTALLGEYQKLPKTGIKGSKKAVKKLELLESIYDGYSADPHILFDFKGLENFKRRPGQAGPVYGKRSVFTPSNLTKKEHKNYADKVKATAGRIAEDLRQTPELQPDIFYKSYANSRAFWSLEIAKAITYLQMSDGSLRSKKKRYRDFHQTMSTMTSTERRKHEEWLQEVEKVAISSSENKGLEVPESYFDREKVAYETTLSFLDKLAVGKFSGANFKVSNSRSDQPSLRRSEGRISPRKGETEMRSGVKEEIEKAMAALRRDFLKMDLVASAVVQDDLLGKFYATKENPLGTPPELGEFVPSLKKQDNAFIFFDHREFWQILWAIRRYYKDTGITTLPSQAAKNYFQHHHVLTNHAARIWVGTYYFDAVMCLSYYLRELHRTKILSTKEYRALRAEWKKLKSEFDEATGDIWGGYDAAAYRDGNIILDEPAFIHRLKKRLAKNPELAHELIRSVAKHVRVVRQRYIRPSQPVFSWYGAQTSGQGGWKYDGYAMDRGQDSAKTNAFDYAVLVLCLTALLKEYEKIPAEASAETEKIKKLTLLESIRVGFSADPVSLFNFKGLKKFEQRPGERFLPEGMTPFFLSKSLTDEIKDYEKTLTRLARQLFDDLLSTPELAPQIFFRSYANSLSPWPQNILAVSASQAMLNDPRYTGRTYTQFFQTLSIMPEITRREHQLWLDTIEETITADQTISLSLLTAGVRGFDLAREESTYQSILFYLHRLSDGSLGGYFENLKSSKAANAQGRRSEMRQAVNSWFSELVRLMKMHWNAFKNKTEREHITQTKQGVHLVLHPENTTDMPPLVAEVPVEILEVGPEEWPQIKEAITRLENVFKSKKRYSSHWLQKAFNDPEKIRLVAKQNGEIVGYLLAGPLEKYSGLIDVKNDSNLNKRNTVYSESMVVYPHKQGRGIGTELQKKLDLLILKKGFRFKTAHRRKGVAAKIGAVVVSRNTNWANTGKTYEYARTDLQAQRQLSAASSESRIPKADNQSIRSEMRNQEGAKTGDGESDRQETGQEAYARIVQKRKDYLNSAPELAENIRTHLKKQGVEPEQVTRLIYPSGEYDRKTVLGFLKVFPNIRRVIIVSLFSGQDIERVKKTWHDEFERLAAEDLYAPVNGLPEMEIHQADYFDFRGAIPGKKISGGQTILVDKAPGPFAVMRKNARDGKSINRDLQDGDLVFSLPHTSETQANKPFGEVLADQIELPFVQDDVRWTIQRITHRQKFNNYIGDGGGSAYPFALRIWHYFYQTLKTLTFLTGKKWFVQIEGYENLFPKKSFIFAGNHTGYYDGILIATHLFPLIGRLPLFISKTKHIGKIGQWLVKNGGGLPVAEEGGTVPKTIEHIDQNHGTVVALFPAGHAEKVHEVMGRADANVEMAAGHLFWRSQTAAILAIEINTPLVPFAIDTNIPRQWTAGDFLKALGHWFLPGKPAPPVYVHVKIGKPILPQDKKADALMQELKHAVAGLLVEVVHSHPRSEMRATLSEKREETSMFGLAQIRPAELETFVRKQKLQDDYLNRTSEMMASVQALLRQKGVEPEQVTRLIYPAGENDWIAVLGFLKIFPNIREVIVVSLFLEQEIERVEAIWQAEFNRLARDSVYGTPGKPPNIRIRKANYYEFQGAIPDAKIKGGQTVLIDKAPGYRASMRKEPEYAESIERDLQEGDLVFSLPHWSEKVANKPFGEILAEKIEMPFMQEPTKWTIQRIEKSKDMAGSAKPRLLAAARPQSGIRDQLMHSNLRSALSVDEAAHFFEEGYWIEFSDPKKDYFTRVHNHNPAKFRDGKGPGKIGITSFGREDINVGDVFPELPRKQGLGRAFIALTLLMTYGGSDAIPFKVHYGHNYLKDSPHQLPKPFEITSRPINGLYHFISGMIPAISSVDLDLLKKLNQQNRAEARAGSTKKVSNKKALADTRGQWKKLLNQYGAVGVIAGALEITHASVIRKLKKHHLHGDALQQRRERQEDAKAFFEKAYVRYEGSAKKIRKAIGIGLATAHSRIRFYNFRKSKILQQKIAVRRTLRIIYVQEGGGMLAVSKRAKQSVPVLERMMNEFEIFTDPEIKIALRLRNYYVQSLNTAEAARDMGWKNSQWKAHRILNAYGILDRYPPAKAYGRSEMRAHISRANTAMVFIHTGGMGFRDPLALDNRRVALPAIKRLQKIAGQEMEFQIEGHPSHLPPRPDRLIVSQPNNSRITYPSAYSFNELQTAKRFVLAGGECEACFQAAFEALLKQVAAQNEKIEIHLAADAIYQVVPVSLPERPLYIQNESQKVTPKALRKMVAVTVQENQLEKNTSIMTGQDFLAANKLGLSTGSETRITLWEKTEDMDNWIRTDQLMASRSETHGSTMLTTGSTSSGFESSITKEHPRSESRADINSLLNRVDSLPDGDKEAFLKFTKNYIKPANPMTWVGVTPIRNVPFGLLSGNGAIRPELSAEEKKAWLEKAGIIFKMTEPMLDINRNIVNDALIDFGHAFLNHDREKAAQALRPLESLFMLGSKISLLISELIKFVQNDLNRPVFPPPKEFVPKVPLDIPVPNLEMKPEIGVEVRSEARLEQEMEKAALELFLALEKFLPQIEAWIKAEKTDEPTAQEQLKINDAMAGLLDGYRNRFWKKVPKGHPGYRVIGDGTSKTLFVWQNTAVLIEMGEFGAEAQTYNLEALQYLRFFIQTMTEHLRNGRWSELKDYYDGNEIHADKVSRSETRNGVSAARQTVKLELRGYQISPELKTTPLKNKRLILTFQPTEDGVDHFKMEFDGQDAPTYRDILTALRLSLTLTKISINHVVQPGILIGKIIPAGAQVIGFSHLLQEQQEKVVVANPVTPRRAITSLSAKKHFIVKGISLADLIWANSGRSFTKNILPDERVRLKKIRAAWNYLSPDQRMVMRKYDGIGQPKEGSFEKIAISLDRHPASLAERHQKALKQIENLQTGAVVLSKETGVPEEYIKQVYDTDLNVKQRLLLVFDYGFGKPRETNDAVIADIISKKIKKPFNRRQVAELRESMVLKMRKIAIEKGWAERGILRHRKIKHKSPKWPETKIDKFMRETPNDQMTITELASHGFAYIYNLLRERHGSWDAALQHYGRDSIKIRELAVQAKQKKMQRQAAAVDKPAKRRWAGPETKPFKARAKRISYIKEKGPQALERLTPQQRQIVEALRTLSQPSNQAIADFIGGSSIYSVDNQLRTIKKRIAMAKKKSATSSGNIADLPKPATKAPTKNRTTSSARDKKEKGKDSPQPIASNAKPEAANFLSPKFVSLISRVDTKASARTPPAPRKKKSAVIPGSSAKSPMTREQSDEFFRRFSKGFIRKLTEHEQGVLQEFLRPNQPSNEAIAIKLKSTKPRVSKTLSTIKNKALANPSFAFRARSEMREIKHRQIRTALLPEEFEFDEETIRAAFKKVGWKIGDTKFLSEQAAYTDIIIPSTESKKGQRAKLLFWKGFPLAVYWPDEKLKQHQLALLIKPETQNITNHFFKLLLLEHFEVLFENRLEQKVENRFEQKVYARWEWKVHAHPLLRISVPQTTLRHIAEQVENWVYSYRDVFTPESFEAGQFAQYVKKNVSLNDKATLYDLGTGSGIQSLSAAEKWNIAHVAAVDHNLFALVSAALNFNRSGPPQTTFRLLHADLAYPKGWQSLIRKYGKRELILASLPVADVNGNAISIRQPDRENLYDTNNRIKTQFVGFAPKILKANGNIFTLNDRSFFTQIKQIGFEIKILGRNSQVSPYYFYQIRSPRSEMREIPVKYLDRLTLRINDYFENQIAWDFVRHAAKPRSEIRRVEILLMAVVGGLIAIGLWLTKQHDLKDEMKTLENPPVTKEIKGQTVRSSFLETHRKGPRRPAALYNFEYEQKNREALRDWVKEVLEQDWESITLTQRKKLYKKLMTLTHSRTLPPVGKSFDKYQIFEIEFGLLDEENERLDEALVALANAYLQNDEIDIMTKLSWLIGDDEKAIRLLLLAAEKKDLSENERKVLFQMARERAAEGTNPFQGLAEIGYSRLGEKENPDSEIEAIEEKLAEDSEIDSEQRDQGLRALVTLAGVAGNESVMSSALDQITDPARYREALRYSDPVLDIHEFAESREAVNTTPVESLLPEVKFDPDAIEKEQDQTVSKESGSRSEQRSFGAASKNVLDIGAALISRAELVDLSDENYVAFCKTAANKRLHVIVFGEDNSSHSETRVQELQNLLHIQVITGDENKALQKVPRGRVVIISTRSETRELRKGVARVAARGAAALLALGLLWTITDIPLQLKDGYLTDPSGWFLERAHTFLTQLVFARAA